MTQIRIQIVAALFTCAASSAWAAENAVIFGPDQDLSAGALALQAGDFEEGVRLTQLGLKIEKSRRDRATGLANLCAGLVGLRRYAEALEACDDSIEINDHNWHAFNNRSLAYLGLDRVERARADLNRGLELNSGARKLLKVADMINERSALVMADATPK